MKRGLIHFLLIAVMAVSSVSVFAQTTTVKVSLLIQKQANLWWVLPLW